MLHEIQLAEAQQNLKTLVERSICGEEIVILINDEPVAKIIPYKPKKVGRKLGTAKGLVFVHEDFKQIPEGFEGYMP